MDVRDETPADVAAVRAVHHASFPTPAEAALVDRLRNEGWSVLSLVAIAEGRVVGHAMLSRMQSPAQALGLAPVAVSAGHRRRGIAAALIREGLARAKAGGWRMVFVLGEPAYYGRFGFDPRVAAGFASAYAGPHLLGLPLRSSDGIAAGGALEYAGPFAALA